MGKKATEKALIESYQAMSEEGRVALLDYAEYLVDRYPAPVNDVPTEPQDIPRPSEESVVASIRRLRSTYPMLDTEKLLHETSSFMMQHMVQGRPANEVIDDLEVYFSTEYQVYIEQSADATND